MEFLKFSYLAASMPDYWELSFKTSMLSLHNRTIGSHIFMKIRNWITFRLECCSTPRSATGCLWPESKCVVNIIFIKTRFFKLFRSQVTGELVYNGTDNFKMCQFAGTKMLSVREKPLNPGDSRLQHKLKCRNICHSFLVSCCFLIFYTINQ